MSSAATPLRTVAVAAALLALTGALLVPGAARAQDDPVPVLDLTLTHITPVLGPDRDLPEALAADLDRDATARPPGELEIRALVENRGPEVVANLQAVVEIFPAATSRSALRIALEQDAPEGPALHIEDLEVSPDGSVAPLEMRGLRTIIAVDDLGLPDHGGVHPVRVSLRIGTEVVARTTSAVVWLTSAPESPLLTTLVWPFDEAPWLTVGGSYRANAGLSLQPGRRLDVLLTALERHPDTPVLFAPAVHLVKELHDRADGYRRLVRQDGGALESREVAPEDPGARLANNTLQRLREATRGLPYAPVVGAYADADLPSLLAGGTGTGDLVAVATSESRRQIQRLLGRAPDAGVFLGTGPLDEATLDVIPGDVLLLPYAAVQGPNPAADPDLPAAVGTLRSPAGRPLTALVADPHLTALLEGTDRGPVHDAQAVLASTAMIYFASPGTANRALSMQPPVLWDPDPRFLDLLLSRLPSAPWLQFESPSTIVASALQSSDPLRLAARELPMMPDSLRDGIAQARRSVDALRAASPEDVELERTPDELEDLLMRATSWWYRGAADVTAEALVRDVASAVDQAFGSIEVAGDTLITLTSDTGQIPVTLRRSRGGPIKVRVEVMSQGRLVWDHRSEELLLEENSTHTVSFGTRALSTGTFAVGVRVTDPTGARELQRTTLSVRSTAISRPALYAIGGLVLVLLLAGAVRRRRPERHLEVVH